MKDGAGCVAVMSDDQASTLTAAGVAKKGPGLPAKLFPAGNGDLPATPLSTLAKTVKTRIHLKVRAAPARLTGCRNVLFRIAELDKVRWT